MARKNTTRTTPEQRHATPAEQAEDLRIAEQWTPINEHWRPIDPSGDDPASSVRRLAEREAEQFADFEVIATYSRVEAIQDGVLVDVSETAKEAGFSAPVALTSAAWANTVEWDESNPEPQDETGRLWDVLTMAAHAARRAHGSSSVAFRVLRVANERPERQWAQSDLVPLRMVIGPGDTAAPVITIMEPDED